MVKYDPPALGAYGTHELEKRLFNAFKSDKHGEVTPAFTKAVQRHSLRGNLWSYRSPVINHCIYFNQEVTVKSLKVLSQNFGLTENILILGLCMVAEARASGVEQMDYTLFTPQRDGPQDDASIGLFADYRDVCIDTPRSASVLDVVLAINRKIKNRQWTAYNPIEVFQRTLVNFRDGDKEPRGSRPGRFVRLEEQEQMSKDNSIYGKDSAVVKSALTAKFE